MPVEIRVGPPTITISQGRTFLVTTHKGEILSNTPQGIYAMDTRFISFYRIYINRIPLELIDFNQLSFYAARIHLTNPQIDTEENTLPPHTLRVSINRRVNEHIYEDITLANYSGQKVKLMLEIALRSDFADLFEVRKQHIILRGKIETIWDCQRKQLYTSYDNKDFHRAITFSPHTNVPFGHANGRTYFEIELEPTQHWHSHNEFILEYKKTTSPAETLETCGGFGQASVPANPVLSQEDKLFSQFDERQIRWQKRCTEIATSNNIFYRMYRR